MEKERVEEMKEYMQTLMDVKIALTEIKSDVKQITDVKNDLGIIARQSSEADNRSKNNEKDITDVNKRIDGIEENDRKKWGAILTVAAAFVFQLIYFLMTYHF